MDRVYVKCCGALSVAAVNWNEAYQLALEMGDSTMLSAAARQAELHRVEREFEAVAAQGAAAIVSMDSSGPRPVPKELLCYRDKNIFYRVLPESRAGRSIVAALRGVLQSRSALLTVPLTSLFLYRGTPVLAQALAPLGAGPAKVCGDGAEVSEEVTAELAVVADALNTPLPDQIVCDVYRGLDGRMYVTNTNITTIALDDSMLVGGPLKRPEMLALCPCVTATCEDALNVLRNPVVVEALRHVLDAAADQQCRTLSDTLHFYGVNLCLLHGVLTAFTDYCAGAVDDARRFAEVVAVEMMARTIKQEFYAEVQAKRLGVDEVGITRCFALHLRSAMDAAHGDTFLRLVLRKYVARSDDDATQRLAATLLAARRDRRGAIVERVSSLVGARAALPVDGAEGRREVVWTSLVAGRVTPHLCNPKLMCSLEPLYRSVLTCEAHYLAYCQPLQVRVAVWQGRLGDALDLASAAADQISARYGGTSLRAVQAQRVFMRLLFSVPTLENVREAYRLVTPILEVYQDRAGPVARARCHIEVGCCLLGAASVMDVVGEAARHFVAAERLLPASLRSSAGAWLYLQPSLGLVRCRQLDRSSTAVPPLESLVPDAVYFSRVVAPADYCTEYLWELGMELAAERHYAASTQILTAAYSLARRTQRTRLDVDGLRDDTLRVYSEWDPEQYAAYCSAVAQSTRAT
ncbi:Clustered mitochondria [Novymonas esmeraldas]|uniref:Clustered mitochondria n=1 Tax=Novymonas esmeraldas TaxID=1808958 RepID=A0AAW0EMW9_9TRYP